MLNLTFNTYSIYYKHYSTIKALLVALLLLYLLITYSIKNIATIIKFNNIYYC